MNPAERIVWIPDYVEPGRTTSFTGFGINPAPFGHEGYTAYRLTPVKPLVPVVSRDDDGDTT